MADYTISFNLFLKHSAPFVFNANELPPSISLHIRPDLRLPVVAQVCRTGTDGARRVKRAVITKKHKGTGATAP